MATFSATRSALVLSLSKPKAAVSSLFSSPVPLTTATYHKPARAGFSSSTEYNPGGQNVPDEHNAEERGYDKETAEAARASIERARRDKSEDDHAGESTIRMAESAAGGWTKDTAESAAEKAKQTVDGAWQAAKERTHEIKETVLGKDDERRERNG